MVLSLRCRLIMSSHFPSNPQGMLLQLGELGIGVTTPHWRVRGCHMARRIMSMKNPKDTIGNQTCDLPACNRVPKPTAPLRAPSIILRVCKNRCTPVCIKENFRRLGMCNLHFQTWFQLQTVFQILRRFSITSRKMYDTHETRWINCVKDI